MRPSRLSTALGALGLVVAVLIATYGKTGAVICQGPTDSCPTDHISWAWTIGSGIVVAAAVMVSSALRGSGERHVRLSRDK